MSLVDGFLLRIQTYLEKGVIYSRQELKNKNFMNNFIRSIFEMMNHTEAYFVSMVVYFDRLIARHSALINESNMIRLIFISSVVALKMFDDFTYKNSYFAQISGVSNKEINYLEHQFLQWIEFNLMICREEYERYYHTLISYINS